MSFDKYEHINVENKKSNFYVSGDFKNEEDEIKVSSLKNIFRMFFTKLFPIFNEKLSQFFEKEFPKKNS